jgi:hypothetical protein
MKHTFFALILVLASAGAANAQVAINADATLDGKTKTEKVHEEMIGRTMHDADGNLAEHQASSTHQINPDVAVDVDGDGDADGVLQSETKVNTSTSVDRSVK